jgi:hypothetical protein
MKQFLVDSPPLQPRILPRVYGRPSPRTTAPKRGRQLVQWITEEADEQLQLGARIGQVPVSKSDVKYLRYLLQWIEGIEADDHR